jgi:hypothetical protein
MKSKQAKELYVKIEQIQSLMVAYVTGERTNTQPYEYRELYDEVYFNLEENKYENPNPHKSLELFWSYCKLKNMGTYADRRAYVDEVYSDILLDLKRIQRNKPDPKNWKKTNEILNDSLAPVRTQWLKAKNFIVSNNPDFENSIKESINSIESTLKILLNKPKHTLGKLVKHESIDKDIQKLIDMAYGLLSNKDFIRHGGVQEQIINKEEAEFFLEFAAISIIYIKEKLDKKAITRHSS